MKDRARFVDFIVIFAIALIAYLITCCRTVFVGDSGELTTALFSGGIAHPPGYPLYTILGYLWVKALFFIRPALAANLFSSVATALAAALLYRLLAVLSKKTFPTIINRALALLFAFSYPIWIHATQAEVYALSALLFVSALLAVINYYQNSSDKNLYLMFFLSGLVLTHHFSAGVVIIATVLAVVFKGRHTSRWSFLRIGRVVGLFCLPLFLYLYLFLRYDSSLPVNWMTEHSPTALWEMMTGAIYQQYTGIPTLGDSLLFLSQLARDLFWDGGPILLSLGIIGLVAGFLKDKRLFALFIAPAILNIVLVSCYHIPDYQGYLVPLIVILIIGLRALIELILLRFPVRHIGFIHVISFLLVIAPLLQNYPLCDLSDITIGERYARDILDSAPSNGIVTLVSDNAAHPVLYLRCVEKYRPDVTVYSSNSTLARMRSDFGNREYGDVINSLRTNPKACFGREYLINQNTPSYSEYGEGLLVLSPGAKPVNASIGNDIDSFITNELESIANNRDLKIQQVYLGYILYQIDRIITEGNPQLSNVVLRLRQWGKHLADPMTNLAISRFFQSRRMLTESHFWIDKILAFKQPSYIAKEVYIALGSLYRQERKYEQALQALDQALDIDPTYTSARYNFFLVKSELLVHERKLAEAIVIFDSLLAIEPDNPLLYYNKALVCDKVPGYDQEALTCYQFAIDKGNNQLPKYIIDNALSRIDELKGMASRR